MLTYLFLLLFVLFTLRSTKLVASVRGKLVRKGPSDDDVFLEDLEMGYYSSTFYQGSLLTPFAW